MEKVLSQEEVDALLKGVADGNIETEARFRSDDRMDELVDLWDAGILVNSSFDLERILVHLMEVSLKMTLADVGSIVLLDGQMLKTKIIWGLDERVLQGVRLKDTGIPVFEESIKRGEVLLYRNLAENPHIKLDEQDIIIESILCVPLVSKERVVGVINIINSMRVAEFDAFAKKMISAVAGFAAVAIENSILHNTALQKQKYEQELNLGRDIQLSLLPKTPPQVEGLEISAKYAANRQIGGGYYDFIHRDNQLHIVMADVSSKGVPAALFMIATRAILRGSVTASSSPNEVLERSNRLIYRDIKRDAAMFVTMFYGRIDTKEEKMVYTNAGHCHPFVFRTGVEGPVRLKEGGMPLGMVDEKKYEQCEIQLKKGDLLFFYTDGVTESINSQRDLFGEARTCEFLKNHRMLSPSDLVDRLFDVLMEFKGEEPQSDDIAMVAIRLV